MKLIIDIPDEQYEYLSKIADAGQEPLGYFERVIMRGTPLPKGHGALKDANEIIKAMDTWDKFGYTETGCFVRKPCNDYVPYVYFEDMVKSVTGTETIIEADKIESEE